VVETSTQGAGIKGGPRFHEMSDRELLLFKELRLGNGAHLDRVKGAAHQVASVMLDDTPIFIRDPANHAAMKLSFLSETTSQARAAKYMSDHSFLTRALANSVRVS
jgi:hypothetical protein